MTESREQFRARIGLIGFAGFHAHIDMDEADMEWADESIATRDDHMAAAEAVYAAALRDMAQEFDDHHGFMGHDVATTIYEFAASLGIDLGDAP